MSGATQYTIGRVIINIQNTYTATQQSTLMRFFNAVFSDPTISAELANKTSVTVNFGPIPFGFGVGKTNANTTQNPIIVLSATSLQFDANGNPYELLGVGPKYTFSFLDAIIHETTHITDTNLVADATNQYHSFPKGPDQDINHIAGEYVFRTLEIDAYNRVLAANTNGKGTNITEYSDNGDETQRRDAAQAAIENYIANIDEKTMLAGTHYKRPDFVDYFKTLMPTPDEPIGSLSGIQNVSQSSMRSHRSPRA